MSRRLVAPLLVAVALGAAACSGGPSVSTTTSTSSPAATAGTAASPGAGRRAGLAGTVSSFDGTTLVLATRQGGSVTVETSGSTAVTKSVTGTVSDITLNDAVVVTGAVNPDGSYAATGIVIAAGALGGNRPGTPSPRPSAGAGGFGGRRAGTAGTVAAVKGDNLTLTTAQGATVTVVTSATTVVTKSVTGALSDVTAGETVTVTGPQNADGTYAATRIIVGGSGRGGLFGGGGGAGTPVTGA